MKLRSTILGIAMAAGLLTAALARPASAAEAINLLPLGDSITAQALYYSPLTTMLSNNGYSPTILANDGHSGFIIDGSISGAPRQGLAENTQQGGLEGSPTGTDFLNVPGVNAANTFILLMIGTNDVDTDFDLAPGTRDPADGNIVVDPAARMAHLISDIRTEAPLAHLIVAEIIPDLRSGLGGAQDIATQQFNTDIATVVTGPNVSLVNMYSAFRSYPGYQANQSVLMTDVLHPNQTGGNVMAGVWFAGIQAVPEPGSIVLFGLGAVGLLVAARRRRRA